MGDDGLGKDAETRIREWLDVPTSGYSFDRIYDQMTGFYQVSRNICDFFCYKYPEMYYIESKATWSPRFDFSMLSDTQYKGLLKKSMIPGCHGLVIALFATQQVAVILDIRDIQYLIEKKNKKSVNITKIGRWGIPYAQIETIPSRKKLLEYKGDFAALVSELEQLRGKFDYE